MIMSVHQQWPALTLRCARSERVTSSMSEDLPNAAPADPEDPGKQAPAKQRGQPFAQPPGQPQQFGQQPGPQSGQPQFGQQSGQPQFGQPQFGQTQPFAQPPPGQTQPFAQPPPGQTQPFAQQFGQPGPAGGVPGYPPIQGVPVGRGPHGYGPRGPSDDHMWALFAYLSPIILSFLGPLIIYLVKMNESRFVRYHAAQSLNLLITSTIYGIGILVISFVLAAITHGVGIVFLLLYFVLWIVTLVYLILACIGANRGELYQVPPWLCFKLVH